MICLNDMVLPPTETIIDGLKKSRVSLPVCHDITRKDDILHFEIGNARCAVALMPAPVPWTDLEIPCLSSWTWPQASEVLRNHKAHLVVAIWTSQSDTLGTYLLLTYLVDAVAQVSNSAGICWGAASMVHLPEFFHQFTEISTTAEPPLYLWVNFRVGKANDGTIFLVTTGMSAFGMHEIEIPLSTLPVQELREFGVDIARYLLTSGEQPPSGDTFGRTEDKEYKVVYGQSIMPERSETVMRLEKL